MNLTHRNMALNTVTRCRVPRLRKAVAARWVPMAIAAMLLFLLSACAQTTVQQGAEEPEAAPYSAVFRVLDEDARQARAQPAAMPALDDEDDQQTMETEFYRGSGRFYRAPRAPGAEGEAVGEEGGFVLNFDGTDLNEVIKFILGDLLEENYLVAPGVQGAVTLHSARPLPREALLPTLEELLRINNAALVRTPERYKVVPREGALRNGTTLGDSRVREGYQVRVFPLRFIGVVEMQQILEPFLVPGSLVRADPARNLMILSGTPLELVQWQETIEMFDVDWLQGMSVGLFPLKNAAVEDIDQELQQIIGEAAASPLAGLVRVMPMERLNALLVVTPQAYYLEETRKWIERLDRSEDEATARLHVYRMQYTRAEDVADVLSGIYETGSVKRTQTADRGPSLAPGATAGSISSAEARATGREPGAAPKAKATPERKATVAGAIAGEVRIVADTVNNALLIYASPADYRLLEAALKQLDREPRQVLVEATIAGVTLTDQLKYGLQWFFKNSAGDYDGRGLLTLGDSADLGVPVPSFSYSIVDSAGQIRAVFEALAQEGNVQVLSSPSLLVLDNQSASIRVGDQVPVRSSTSERLDTSSPVVTSDIQYVDTGVLLEVTPRVNAGGQVVMEIVQDVKDVSETASSSIDSPTITQRRIESTVSVQSGDTIVLGGLIAEANSVDESGIPFLHTLPGIGALFGAKDNAQRRVELVVLLTPRVAEGRGQLNAIADEFRRKLTGIAAWEAVRAAEPAGQ